MDYILKPICVFVRYILSAEPQNVSCCQKSHASRKDTYMNQPNILILHLDQLRQDCLGCYGNPDVHTPNIDALAQDSVTYQNHYTVYPICTPSRYSFFSSLYVHQHGAWDNHSTLPNGYPTFPKQLQKSGYHTSAVGKMHMTPTYQNIGFSESSLPSKMESDVLKMITTVS